MATKHLQKSLNDIDVNKCPKCGTQFLSIDGTFVQWLTCPKCKYKKLLEKPDPRTAKVRNI